MNAVHLLALLLAQADVPAQTAELELFVVENGAPVVGARLFIGSEEYGQTDEQGSVVAEIPAGRGKMTVQRGGETLIDLDLLTDEGELILVIATLTPGSPPDLVIESSGSDSVLASEATGSPKDRIDAAKRDQPPGALVGTVLSAEKKEPIPRAQLFFSGITVEVQTNKDGEFSVELPAGVYSVSIVHPRYSSQTLENIRVIPERQVKVDIELTPAGVRLQDYVVTAPYVEGSIASVVEQQREASGVSDVLGAAQISATGDSNAAEALTRVTGLTVEEGKFVLIRGQPSRFTLALFNGSPLPSPEPLLQLVPLDLFPTGVLQGIEVQKSFTPDKPGSFGAGLVELNTRAVPDEPFLKLSVTSGYNTQSTFDDGFTYDGGSYDYFSFDDGTRALPDPVAAATNNGERSLSVLSAEEQAALSATFPNVLDPDEKTLPPDLSIGLSSGGKMPIAWDGTFGVLVTGSFSNKWRNQERIQRDNGLSGGELFTLIDLLENRTDNVSTLSGLLTLSGIWDQHEVSLNTFVVNQSQQRTEFITGNDVSGSGEPFQVQRTILSWIERSLVAQQVTGKHDFDFLMLEYRGLIASAERDAPDRREYEFGLLEGRDQFVVQRGRGLERSYSFVDDIQIAYGADVTLSFIEMFDGGDEWWIQPKLKVGFSRAEAEREAGEQRFLWNVSPQGDGRLRSAEEVFDPTLVATGELEFTDASLLGADDYEGDSSVTGAYAQLDVEIADLFRIVGGFRYESADYTVESFQLANIGGEVSSSGFEQDELLPAVLLTWFALDELQIRGAYGRSVSRPVFNEIAPSFFFDPDSGQQFQGEPDLEPTVIDGYEVRAEWYPSTTESLTAGVFLKEYSNPIEQSFGALGGGSLIATFQNAAEATVTGFEVGGRFELGRIRDWLDLRTDWLENFYMSGNVAVLDSEVELDADQIGVATSAVRRLQGQADIVINAQAGFDGEELDVTLSYNRVGERLAAIGVFGQPDYVQDPINSLDVNITWEFFEGAQLKLSGSNLLDATIRINQTGGDPVSTLVWREFKRGRDYSIGISYEF